MNINGAIDKLIRTFGISWVNKMLDARDSVDGLFGLGPNAAANAQTNPAVAPMPLGSQGMGPLTNQNVKQQTTINVMGSADAGQIGKSVAGEQSKVNFDMIRNMKGAAR